MKTAHLPLLVATALVCVLATGTALAQTAPKLKMTTDIPAEITTPDSVETRLGTLKFFDGFPDKETTQKVYDNLDFQRGVQAFLTCIGGASASAIRHALREVRPGQRDGRTLRILDGFKVAVPHRQHRECLYLGLVEPEGRPDGHGNTAESARHCS